MSNRVTLASVLESGFSQHSKNSTSLTSAHYRVVEDILRCRTSDAGSRSEQCDHCGQKHVLYNSCRNRHCPQCQAIARIRWVENRMEELLPVPYSHVVFTMPQELNPWALRNKKVFYSLLFRSVKETLIELGDDPKRLGASVGFIMMLHTWGQTLVDHPHVHCIVPAGGIAHDDNRWIPCKNSFLFPVKVVSKLFRGKLLSYFKEAVENKTIVPHGSLVFSPGCKELRRFMDTLYKKEWVVYIKKPMEGPAAVVEYLGNYTHRIAIANSRLLGLDCEKQAVSFSYKDYADENKKKVMTLKTDEFIRRFLLHVVPSGFMRIRHCGFLSCRSKPVSLQRLRPVFKAMKPYTPAKERVKKPWHELIKEKTGRDPRICSHCKQGMMRIVSVLEPAREGWRANTKNTGVNT